MAYKLFLGSPGTPVVPSCFRLDCGIMCKLRHNQCTIISSASRCPMSPRGGPCATMRSRRHPEMALFLRHVWRRDRLFRGFYRRRTQPHMRANPSGYQLQHWLILIETSQVFLLDSLESRTTTIYCTQNKHEERKYRHHPTHLLMRQIKK